MHELTSCKAEQKALNIEQYVFHQVLQKCEKRHLWIKFKVKHLQSRWPEGIKYFQIPVFV